MNSEDTGTAIIEAKATHLTPSERILAPAWCERDETLGNIEKSTFYRAAQAEYGDAEQWNAETWTQVTADLQNCKEWVKQCAAKGTF